MSIKIDIDGMVAITRNELRHQKHIGKVISRIVLPVYDIIWNEAHGLNLYTYEVEYGIQAFPWQSFDFEDEDVLLVEFMAYFMSEQATGPYAKLIRDLLKPFPFDPALEADYLAALRSERNKLTVLDELEAYYEDVENVKERREIVEAATSGHLSYGDEDEGEEDDDWLNENDADPNDVEER